MELYSSVFLALLPWFVFIIFVCIAHLLIRFAKKRRGIAMVFGVLVQMMLPDPQVEKTIETMVVKKRAAEEKQKQAED